MGTQEQAGQESASSPSPSPSPATNTTDVPSEKDVTYEDFMEDERKDNEEAQARCQRIAESAQDLGPPLDSRKIRSLSDMAGDLVDSLSEREPRNRRNFHRQMEQVAARLDRGLNARDDQETSARKLWATAMKYLSTSDASPASGVFDELRFLVGSRFGQDAFEPDGDPKSGAYGKWWFSEKVAEHVASMAASEIERVNRALLDKLARLGGELHLELAAEGKRKSEKPPLSETDRCIAKFIIDRPGSTASEIATSTRYPENYIYQRFSKILTPHYGFRNAGGGKGYFPPKPLSPDLSSL